MRCFLPLCFLLLAPIAVLADGGVVEVSFDIKPTSCPNPFNPDDVLTLAPTFPTAILGEDDVDVSNIRVEGLVIISPGGGGRGEGGDVLAPISFNYEDVATPVQDDTQCACTTDGPDGFTDLTLHFDADAFRDLLGEIGPGDQLEICISGTFLDGTPFLGCDCIFIVGPTPVETSSWGSVKATYR